MGKLEDVYPVAIEQTKNKVSQDIEKYLGEKEDLPSFQDYLLERGDYLAQIWVNVWLNKVTNDVPKEEKKQYLHERGFETKDTSRKIINHLFRTEVRNYKPFDAAEWIKSKFRGNEESWEQKYHSARINFQLRKETELLQVKKLKIREGIEEFVEEYFHNHYELLYLHVRHVTAQRVKADFINRKKYQKVDTFALEEKLVEEGTFNPDDYTTLSGFLEDLTGDIHKTHHKGRSYFEYETYFDIYERLIFDYLYELVPEELLTALTNHFEVQQDLDSQSFAKEVINEALVEVAYAFVEELAEEYISDLLKLAEISFDEDLHKEIFESDIADRKRKLAEERAEMERRRQDEIRMLDDIFGEEYRLSRNSRIKYVLHLGETNTGKTYHALGKMKEADSGLYLAPLRLLALEVYDKLNDEGTPCSLKTGEEEKLVHEASHISCTIEMFHEKDFYDVVVIDEAQMIADKDRGYSWYKAITKANAGEVHVIGSRNVKTMLLELLKDSDVEIYEYHRDIPLEVEKREFKINTVKKGDALICFSRKRVLETASRLQNDGRAASMIYGSMPPETRKKQIQRFIEGETTVIVATDAIGMGLNLPIRRIVFLENEKFDGTRRRLLTSQEVKQIAGRAGRKGLYNTGRVAFTADINRMKQLLLQEDETLQTFAITPTSEMLDRFQKYSRDLGTFFDLWMKFESPKGTKKAPLTEERELYEMIRDTEMEARLSLKDLYSFLQLPFSSREPSLTRQWEETIMAIITGDEMPEPKLKLRNLEELELTYKAIGLHLLFLYRLNRPTEAVYWERVREEISDKVHERLKTDVKNMSRKCKRCGKKLAWDHRFPICDACFETQSRRNYSRY